MCEGGGRLAGWWSMCEGGAGWQGGGVCVRGGG